MFWNHLHKYINVICNILLCLYLLAGMWSSSFYLGNFLGPTIGGFIVEAYGFAWTTIVYFCLYCFMILINSCDLVYGIFVKRNKVLPDV